MSQLADSEIEFLRRLAREAGAEKLILFGSYADGTAWEHSDVDLIAIKECRLPFVERFKEFPEWWEFRKPIELFVYTPEEFKDMVERENSFILSALEKGKVLYERPQE